MKLGERILDLFYPRFCSACGGIPEEGAICAACSAGLEWIQGDGCGRCGAELREGVACVSCKDRTFLFDRAVAAGAYRGGLRNLILKFKFHGERMLAWDFGRRLADRVRAARIDVDGVTFVPTRTWKLLWERRYNAGEILAERVAAELDRPLLRVLKKRRSTGPQMELPLEQRLTNLKDAFVSKKVRGRRLLLVDDVLTTGSTASECARALSQAGAVSTSLAVVARSY